MHELRDENGNLIPHGGHDHHHDHDHGEKKDATLALLSYMVDHNRHHAAELSDMAGEISGKGMTEVADLMKEGVAELEKGNELLAKALELYKSRKKED
ncbi:MAG: cobalt transporter [Eubacterium sp.]|nr:cobalt transporter [Eubacterium sp.]